MNRAAANEGSGDWGLSAAFRDLNGDGAPDLYVCNDFITPDRIWLNDGRGRFRAISPVALRNTSTFSMAVDFADIDRDGFDDLFLADMLDVNHQMRIVEFEAMDASAMGLAGILERPQVNRNTLQRNRGDGTYAEVAITRAWRPQVGPGRVHSSTWIWTVMKIWSCPPAIHSTRRILTRGPASTPLDGWARTKSTKS